MSVTNTSTASSVSNSHSSSLPNLPDPEAEANKVKRTNLAAQQAIASNTPSASQWVAQNQIGSPSNTPVPDDIFVKRVLDELFETEDTQSTPRLLRPPPIVRAQERQKVNLHPAEQPQQSVSPFMLAQQQQAPPSMFWMQQPEAAAHQQTNPHQAQLPRAPGLAHQPQQAPPSMFWQQPEAAHQQANPHQAQLPRRTAHPWYSPLADQPQEQRVEAARQPQVVGPHPQQQQPKTAPFRSWMTYPPLRTRQEKTSPNLENLVGISPRTDVNIYKVLLDLQKKMEEENKLRPR